MADPTGPVILGAIDRDIGWRQHGVAQATLSGGNYLLTPLMLGDYTVVITDSHTLACVFAMCRRFPCFGVP